MENQNIDQDQLLKGHNFINTLWRYADLARYLQVSQEFVRHAVMYQKIPFIKIGRCVRFDPAEIESWLKSITVKPETKQ
jgi:excisionase family DNA binding protein